MQLVEPAAIPAKFDFGITEISRDECLKMVRTYHYSDTLPKINKHYLGCFWGGNSLVQ